MAKPKTITERANAYFWSRVDRSGGSDAKWTWLGKKTKDGYGRLWFNGRMVLAHRLAWELTHGPIPANGPGSHGWVVCHRCDERDCVNPAHLWLDTFQADIKDRAEKGRNADHRGVLNGRAKVSEDDIRAIRKALASGESQESIGRRFGLFQTTISRIKLGHAWKHLSQ